MLEDPEAGFEVRQHMRPAGLRGLQLGDLDGRQREAGQHGADDIAQQHDRQREDRVKRRADDRAEQEGAGVQQLHPAVGFDQLVRRYELRDDGLDGGLLEGAADAARAQHDEHRPDR